MTVSTSPPALRLENVTVRYGGNVAVDGVSLAAPEGRITGLIGPNGAGKTTLLNACSGTLGVSDGTVSLFERDVTRRAPAARARLGLGRTFQRMELYDSLTVAENVRMGREAAFLDARPWHHLIARPAESRAVSAGADEALELCGLTGLATRRAGSLSTGQRRLVELARALAGPYRLLLLDEPASGLGQRETETFARILTGAVARRGVGALIVEHDVDLVMGICHYIYVLDFGRLIFEGTPDEVQRSAVVRTAYLGAEA
ncbi:MAG TPA: ABC transporter ATP-binding protein [Acidimicrobiia bacterium]|nr:ABC transporter ATP-binding protein [Acidimicrobiia bacterium]